MQVSVEQLEGLERRLTVQVPAEKIDAEIVDRLKSLSPTVRLHGFRPGKVPLKLLKRMYGDTIRQEVVQQLLQSSFGDAIEQEKLHPIGLPQIEPKNLKEGEALEYSATFEVLPEFETISIDNLSVERPVVVITEADVDATIEKLRWQRARWNTVNRPAQLNDRLLINADSSSSDAGSPHDKQQNVTVMLIEDQARPEFLQHLTGLQAGAETEFDVAYPPDDPVKYLAGKTLHYQIKINSVDEPTLPAVDEDFVHSFDSTVTGVAEFRAIVRDNMERELQERIHKLFQRQLMDNLLAANPMPLLPQALIKAQIASMAKQAGFIDTDTAADADKTDQVETQLFEPEARRRTAFSLIMLQLAKVNGIEVEEARVRNQLAAIASTFEEPMRVMQYYERNPDAVDSVRMMLLENQVIEWLLERVQVIDKPASFNEIMRPESFMVVPAPDPTVQQASVS